MNSGSVDSLNPSVRCGLSSNLRQIRPIVERDRPLRRAIEARDQCVAALGVSSSVAATTSSTWSSRIDGGRPGRGSSASPSSRRDEPAPPPGHRARRDPQPGGHLLVRRALRAGQHDLRPQRQRLAGLGPPRPARELIALVIGQLQPGFRPPRPFAVGQPFQPRPGKPRTPLAHRHLRDAQIGGHPLVHHPRLRAGQHNPGPHRQPSRRPTRPADQLVTLLLGQHELSSGTSSTRHTEIILT